MVYEDAGEGMRRLYYRLGASGRFPLCYLVVVVAYDSEPARILTMYVTKQPSGSTGRLVHVAHRPHR